MIGTNRATAAKKNIPVGAFVIIPGAAVCGNKMYCSECIQGRYLY